MIQLITYIITGALWNHIRGGGFGVDSWMKPHPRFYAAPVFGLMSWSDWPTALIMAVGYLFWAWLPWGRWADLNRFEEGYPWYREITWFEKILNHIPTDALRFLVRNVIGLLPIAVLVNPLFLAMAPIQVLCYELGWKLEPKAPYRLAELMVGAIWGAFIFGLI